MARTSPSLTASWRQAEPPRESGSSLTPSRYSDPSPGAFVSEYCLTNPLGRCTSTWAPGWCVGKGSPMDSSSNPTTPSAVAHLRSTCTRSGALRPEGVVMSERAIGTCSIVATIGSSDGPSRASSSTMSRRRDSSVLWCLSVGSRSAPDGLLLSMPRITDRFESTG